MNIFWAITSGLQWYDALYKTKVWSDIIGKAKQIASPITSAIQPVKETLSKVSQPYADIWSSIMKWMATPQKTTFFSDEQSAYDKMIADNVPETDAIQAIKSRRKDLMWGNTGITSFEQSALKKMQADWISAKEASQMLMEHRKEMEQESKKKYEAMGTGEKLVKWAVGAWLGALSTVWSSTENILGWWAKKLGFDQLWNELQQQAKEYSKAWENIAQDQAYSTGVKTGNIIGGAGMMLAAWWPTGIIWKWEWLLSSIATPWSLIAKNAGLISKVAAWAAWWALQSSAMWIADKWNTSLKEAITGGIIWGWLPIVWAGIWKVKNLITDKIPKSLISSGLMTPSKLLNASERLSRLSDEGIIKADEAPQWMLDKWLKWSKETIQKQLSAISKDAGKKKVALFANDLDNWVAKTYESNATVNELQQALTEVLPNFAKVTKDAIIPKAWNAEKVNALLEFITKPKPTALDIDKARAVLGDMGIFTKGWELADTATKEWLQKIWIDASKLLDDSLPWFRALNKDIEVAHAMWSAMGLKEAQDSVRQLMTLTNIGAGWAWAAYGYAQEWDLAGALKYAGAWLAWKYLFNNPSVTTFVAQKLKELWKEWLITKAIKSPATQRLIRAEAINLSE